MKKAILVSGFFIELLVSCTCLYGADPEGRPSAGVVDGLEAKIRSELGGLQDHPWAGEYFNSGLGLSSHLIIALTAGFVLKERGCLGPIGLAYGIVSESNEHIIVKIVYSDHLTWHSSVLDKYIPVRWGMNRYLVTPDGMIDFCNNANGGMGQLGSVGGNSLCSIREKTIESSIIPQAPSEYRRYFLAQPIVAKIIDVGNRRETVNSDSETMSQIEVTLDKGRKSGLQEGMLVYPYRDGGKNDFSGIKISQINEFTAVGVAILRKGKREPQVGWTLSTSIIDQWNK